jgi:hypothetical protein
VLAPLFAQPQSQEATMTPSTLSFRLTTVVYLLLAAMTLASSGCLLAVAGTAAGGAAVGYAYYKGKVTGSYVASLDDTWKAVHAGLTELGMPLVSEERKGEGGSIYTATAKGEKVRIQLEAVVSKIPAEGTITHVSVRVATFGDKAVSERILTQIGLHLTPVIAVPPPPAPPPVVQSSGSAAPVQTAPPPRLPAASPP